MNPTRGRIAAAFATIVVALAATLALASPASASAYRFWSYWQGATGQWVAAQTGPSDHTVVDTDVQGWRFAITATAPDSPPDNSPSFAALCPDMASGSAPSGQVRVAVVVDSGFAADAPQGQTPPADTVSCVTVPRGSTGSQALSAAGQVSEQSAMVCAINGFPDGECAAEVSDADAATAAQAAATESANPAPVGGADTAAGESSGSSSGSLGLIVGVAALLAALLAAVTVAARRRGAGPGTE